MSRRAEFQVGATVLVALAILIWALAWLKDYTVQRDKRVWTVQFTEAGGLSPSDEVQVNGIRKGDVRSMRLVGDRVIVELNLDREIVMTRDSKVTIRPVGLMGEKVIAVDLRATGVPYRSDEVIPGVYEKDLGAMMGELGETVSSVRGLSEQLERVAGMLAPEGRLANTLENFHRTSEELELVVSENRARFRETMQNVTAASRTARRLTTDKEAELAGALDDFASSARTMERLTTRLDSLSAALQTVATRVERGDGTIGKLVNDEKLYTDLNASLQSVKTLIEEIKRNPRKYFKFSVF